MGRVGRMEGRGTDRNTFEVYYTHLVNRSDFCLEM